MSGRSARLAVLLDVDGVLNAGCDEPREICKCHPGWTRVWAHPNPPYGRYKLTLNPAHGPLLRDLAADNKAELVWATYWEDEANVWVSPTVGLPDNLPHVPIPPQFRQKHSPGEWKALLIASWAKGRPFVWFEDELDAPGTLIKLAASGDYDLGPFLVVTVDERTGLTEDHVAQAAAWMRDLTSESRP